MIRLKHRPELLACRLSDAVVGQTKHRLAAAESSSVPDISVKLKKKPIASFWDAGRYHGWYVGTVRQYWTQCCKREVNRKRRSRNQGFVQADPRHHREYTRRLVAAEPNSVPATV